MRRPNILRDSGSDVIRLGSQMTSVLIITPFLLSHLGEDGYGIWKFIEQTLVYFVIFEPSLRGAMVRFLAEAIGRNDRKDATAIFATCTLIIVPLVSAAAIATFICAPMIMAMPKGISPALRDEGTLTAQIMSVTLGLRMMSLLGVAILNAARRIDLINAIVVPMIWINLAATFTVLSQGGGLVALAILSAVTSAISLLLIIAIVLFHCKGRKYFEKTAIRAARIPGMIRYIFFGFISKLGDTLSLQTPILIYAVMFSIETAAIFAIVRTVERTGRMLAVAFLDSAAPSLTAAISSPPTFNRLVGSFAAVLSLVTFATGTCFVIFGAWFISLWSPIEDPENLVGAFVIWKGLELMLANAKTVGAGVARAKNKMEVMAFWTMGEGIACLSLSLLLAHLIGPTGPIVAIVITQLLGGVAVAPPILRRFANIPLRESVSILYVRPIIGCLAGGIAPFITLNFVSLDSWTSFIGAAIIGCTMVGIGGYAITLQREQRLELWTRIRQIGG